MRSRARAIAVSVLLGAIGGAGGGCFKPSIVEGGFLCAADGKTCPDGLKCASDKRCYRVPPTAATDGGTDQSMMMTCTTPKVAALCADGPAPNQACNPTCQTGCACGRCNVVGSTPTCVPSGTVGVGDVCTLNADNCAPGLTCLPEPCGNALGRCYRFCTSSTQCSDGICQIPVDDADGGDTGFRTCDQPQRTCDPINNTGCPNPALNCYLTSLATTLCDCPSKTVGQNDAPCTIYSDCAPSFVCVTGVNNEATAHCHFVCEVAHPACPSVGDGGSAACMPSNTSATATYGYCLQ